MVDWREVQLKFRWALSFNCYWVDREWQYRSIKPMIIAERLLETSDGRIPDDIKINCINGRAEFIYLSLDREGINKRKVVDIQWKPLPFTWARKEKGSKLADVSLGPPPSSLPKMIELAEQVAKHFPYVRVDFYEVDGSLFLGEITQCHGGGYDRIVPLEWDEAYGKKLDLTVKYS